MRHLKQRKEARYARNVGDGWGDGCGVLDVSWHLVDGPEVKDKRYSSA